MYYNHLGRNFFLLSSLFLVSCHKERVNNEPTPPPPLTSCTSTSNLDFSVCSAIDGCTLEFTCDLLTTKNKHLVNKFTQYMSEIFKASEPVTINITSLTINQPALLQAAPGVAPSNWYTQSIPCTQDGNNVTCANFLPIANDFTLNGTLGDIPLDLNITVQNGGSLATNCGDVQCGLNGTTVERMFDCSMRVANYAGYTDNTQVEHLFAPGDTPDPNWFLVSSPSASDAQQCFWLAPVITNSNPAAGTDQFDSNGIEIASYANSDTQGRLLWSGVSSVNYNFFLANGNNPRNSTPDASYDYYSFIDDNTMASQQNGNPLIYRPQQFSPLPTLTPIICAGTDDPCYDASGSGDESIYNAYVNPSLNYSQSLCSTNNVTGIELLTASSTYLWQMPSYPMVMTITGGGTLCSLNTGDNAAYCNGAAGNTGIGFYAAGNIPGMQDGIWTSSVRTPGISWAFSDGSTDLGLSMGISGMAVRCVSAIW